eukprot:CAMPEP_0194221786 /NCGR_PEP_ID=MMETSP0156-20130528/31341_1 /TAXON_ID=33649 /ORGANISM="Thalassionema nitzschioides, Strain L26-B" /LENGTH=429 /DNA_ID=CAMNT_0038952313 /DNA_START=199 /DNA_END=1488 /DNA_ORIENTATION=+
MANTQEENTGSSRPVAISSTSSLDSFATNYTLTFAEVSSNANDAVIIKVEDTSAIVKSEKQQHISQPAVPSPAIVSSRPSLVSYPLAPSPTSTPATIASSHPSLVCSSSNTNKGNSGNNTVPEFLYQLTKMLTDDNRATIEWNNGKIEVHNPHRLASEVLHQYFRHSKFASFQRQLNYFGFRKLAGKGKMAPCSYVNEAATSDLRSILNIKRKTTPATGREKGCRKRERQITNIEGEGGGIIPNVNPVLAGILHRSSTSEHDIKKSKAVAKLATGRGIKHQLNGYLKHQKPIPPAVDAVQSSHVALARTAVGKGVKHNYIGASQVSLSKGSESSTFNQRNVEKPQFTFQDPYQLGMDVQSSLSELTNNFQNSLLDQEGESGGMLSRNSSLVDLAMLHPVEPTSVSEMEARGEPDFMTFVDFPSQDMKPL